MPLPSAAGPNFIALVAAYRDDIDATFPHLRAITTAQWALESGWGKTVLASEHNNYAGMKWRVSDESRGYPIWYGAHDGKAQYTHFNTPADFIAGYWARLDEVSLYYGWRSHTGSAQSFITFVAPIWLSGSPRMDSAARAYIRDVLRIQDHRTEDLFPPSE